MPKEIELHLSRISNIQDCYQTAKELLTIVQTSVTNKMSALSLAQSRSPSPQPPSRSPSPVTPPLQRSRQRTQFSFYGSNRMLPGRCFNCNRLGHFARNCFTKPRFGFQDEHTSTSQDRDSEWHQPINGHSNRYIYARKSKSQYIF